MGRFDLTQRERGPVQEAEWGEGKEIRVLWAAY